MTVAIFVPVVLESYMPRVSGSQWAGTVDGHTKVRERSGVGL